MTEQLMEIDPPDVDDKLIKQQIELADRYFVCDSFEKAYALYKKISSTKKTGHVCYRLGVIHETGDGAEKDANQSYLYFQDALNLLLKSTSYDEDPDPQDLFDLGVMFGTGYGCVRNDKESFKYYEKGSLKGHALSCCNLGSYYYSGTGCSKDLNKAREYFEKSVEKELVSGYTWLAFLYQNSECSFYNVNKAIEYYRKSAGWSEPFACDKLANGYSQGENFFFGGFTRDVNQAVLYAYLGIHSSASLKSKERENARKILSNELPEAINNYWAKMKEFYFVEELNLEEKRIIFFIMLFECRSDFLYGCRWSTPYV